MHKLLVAGVMACGLAASSQARAAVILYSGQSAESAFDAAVEGAVDYTMPTPDHYDGPGYETLSGTETVGPVTFSASSMFLYNDGLYGAGSYLVSGSGSLLASLSGATAISFVFGTIPAMTIGISINGGSAFSVTTDASETAFFVGFTDTVAITSVRFSYPTGGNQELDMLRFSTANRVPEPDSLLLLGAGVLGLGAVWRRRVI